MAKSILITGGSGFLGSALVKKCLHAGWNVRVLDDNSRGNLRRLQAVIKDIEFIDGDIRNSETVNAATRGVDTVAHLAFINGTEFFYSKPQLVLEVGVKGALNTLDAAIANGVENYWLMSSSEVYQTPPNTPTNETVPLIVPDVLNPRYSYGGGKLISELLAFNYGRGRFSKTIVVRPHNVYGPDMGTEHVLPQFMLRAKELCALTPSGNINFEIKGDGTQTRSFVHVDDFTDGCYAAFSKGADMNVYHVGTLDEVTIANLARKVVLTFGRESNIIPSEAPLGETNRRCPDISKVSELGYLPKIKLDDGLVSMKEWYGK
jgi:nucleoside-diphosphate-sugar epimerase